MSKTTNAIMRIDAALDRISGLSGIVGDMVADKADEIEAMVKDILKNHPNACLFDYYGKPAPTKVLLVAGQWNKSGGCYSPVAGKIADVVKRSGNYEITVHNGGEFRKLSQIADTAEKYEIVFWLAEAPDSPRTLDGLRKIAKKSFLIISKNNRDEEHDFSELVKLVSETNSALMLEFGREGKTRVLDASGCVFCETEDTNEAVTVALGRVECLRDVSLESEVECTEDCKPVPDEKDFISIIREYDKCFQNLMGKNADGMFDGNFAVKLESGIFVSKSNMKSADISLSSLVPVWEKEKRAYYGGKHRPASDTSVYLRLYKELPQIRYILHSHCYIKDAAYTAQCVPCGALEEADEILAVIRKYFDDTQNSYAVNLYGHGSIVLATDIDSLRDIAYVKRPVPEYIT